MIPGQRIDKIIITVERWVESVGAFLPFTFVWEPKDWADQDDPLIEAIYAKKGELEKIETDKISAAGGADPTDLGLL